jgi:alkanesulfonate monooxygenase SsuD/methylene tetrahydromethanopterin reductase-like flavin-dependent oxidoreductase (luciferase family)
VEPAVVVFARTGPEDEARTLGTQWLSELYGVPAKAFDRHLVAGEPAACAAALDRYVEAGARHIVVMIAGSGAVQHFGPLRAAFMAQAAAVPAGVGG